MRGSSRAKPAALHAYYGALCNQFGAYPRHWVFGIGSLPAPPGGDVPLETVIKAEYRILFELCRDARIAFPQKSKRIMSGPHVPFISQFPDSCTYAFHTGSVRIPYMNNRDIFSDADGNHFALDTQHGTFEVLNSKGRHQGEIDFNGWKTKDADKSGGHDIILK